MYMCLCLCLCVCVCCCFLCLLPISIFFFWCCCLGRSPHSQAKAIDQQWKSLSWPKQTLLDSKWIYVCGVCMRTLIWMPLTIDRITMCSWWIAKWLPEYNFSMVSFGQLFENMIIFGIHRWALTANIFDSYSLCHSLGWRTQCQKYETFPSFYAAVYVFVQRIEQIPCLRNMRAICVWVGMSFFECHSLTNSLNCWASYLCYLSSYKCYSNLLF